MFCVDACPNCFVFGVYFAGVGINGQIFEFVVSLVLALLALEYLGVVGHGPGGGLSDDNQQLDGGVHLENALGNLLRDEIGRALLDGDLVREGEGHFTPVPVNAPGVVFVIVKEVNLLRSLDDSRMEVEHFQQGAGPALADSNDDGPRQLLDQVVKAYLIFGGIALA